MQQQFVENENRETNEADDHLQSDVHSTSTNTLYTVLYTPQTHCTLYCTLQNVLKHSLRNAGPSSVQYTHFLPWLFASSILPGLRLAGYHSASEESAANSKVSGEKKV
jgi:hypothetical protein